MDKVIVYSSDGRDIEQLAASVFSIRKFLGEDVKIYVLSETAIDYEIKGITTINPANILRSVGFFEDRWNRRWPYASLFCMFIPIIDEFSNFEKILYLDTDVIVKSELAKDIFNQDLGDNELIAVKCDAKNAWERIDKCVRYDLNAEASYSIINKIWKDKSITNSSYVNTGVSLWSIKNILNNGKEWYIQRLKWFWNAETRGRFEYLAQDFVNSMMNSKDSLDRKYNTLSYSEESKDAYIIHFQRNIVTKLLEFANEIGYSSTEDSSRKTVVYSSDGRDAQRLRMSIESARRFLGSRAKFFILTSLKEYPGVSNVTLVDPAPILNNLGFSPEGWNRKWPYTTLYRLAVPLLEELKSVDKILYLDTDVLVRSTLANKLFELQSFGYEVCGVQDIAQRQYDIENTMYNGLSIEAKTELKKWLWDKRVKVTQGYVNAGVVVEFLDEIRKNGEEWYIKRLKWFWEAVKNGKFKFLDQEFMNVMMDVNPSLSVRFNYFGGDFKTNCALQHFVGATKGSMAPVANSIGIRI